MPANGMGGKGELQDVLVVGESMPQSIPIPLAGLNKLRQPSQLHPPDRRLGIERFEVEAQMAVGVLVVVTLGQFTQLPAKALVAGVINTGRAPTVAAPVAEAFGITLE